MGCDIHVCLEAKKTINNELKWVNIDYWMFNPYYPEENNMLSLQPVYGTQNYALFSILADVRSYNEKSVPISEAKGVPTDCSPQTKAEIDKWFGDGHSHSYLTLKELKNYSDNFKGFVYSGFISPEEANKLDILNELPTYWCQGTSNETWIKREWIDHNNPLDNIIPLIDSRMRDYFWIWDKNQKVPELDEKIRIVFFFDN